jgi:ribonucleoside-diphosphate reductase beta chain
MSIEPLESASLAELQQTPIDNVMNIIDEGLVHLPTYRELYYRWERQQWQSQEIDFSADRQQWLSMTEEERGAHLGSFAAFFLGEAYVADTLAPYITAMPDEEMRLFTTTQLADEARHTIFFSRFFSEVLELDKGRMEETVAAIEQNIGEGLRFILVNALTDISKRIREQPQNLEYLVEGVTLYHVIVEGTLALAGQHGMLDFYRQNNFFPGFRAGFTAVARDESRHIIFGVKFLREMLARDAKYASVVANVINMYGPGAIMGLIGSDEEVQLALANGRDPWETARYGANSLRKKLKVIGLEMNLDWLEVPAPPLA